MTEENKECEICGGEPCDFPEDCNPRREKLESEDYQDFATRAHQGAWGYDSLIEEVFDSRIQKKALRSDNGALQAKIDELMLEYCPDEMTEEQFQNWGDHQVVSDNQHPLPSERKGT